MLSHGLLPTPSSDRQALTSSAVVARADALEVAIVLEPPRDRGQALQMRPRASSRARPPERTGAPAAGRAPRSRRRPVPRRPRPPRRSRRGSLQCGIATPLPIAVEPCRSRSSSLAWRSSALGIGARRAPGARPESAARASRLPASTSVKTSLGSTSSRRLISLRAALPERASPTDSESARGSRTSQPRED